MALPEDPDIEGAGRMKVEVIALLVGLFAAPACLAWYGHRIRTRGASARAAFWGGVIGNAAGVGIFAVAALTSAEHWGGASSARGVLVYWGILICTILGAAAAIAATQMRRARS